MSDSIVHWCISLERREDRRFVLERTAPQTIASRIEFFPAFDGSLIPPARAEARFPGLKPSAWAVRLSKIFLLREFLLSGEELLCLYEDDVIFSERFDEVLAAAIGLEESWDCVFIGGVHSEPPLGDGDFLRCVNTHNNHCLLINRAGARKILTILRRPWSHAWSDREIEGAIKSGELEAWCPREFVAHQREGGSDNWESIESAPRLFAGEPWMQADDAYVLHAACQPGDTVVEWGSGGSTELIADRVGRSGRLISIEHQQEYWELVRSNLNEKSLDQVELCLVRPNPVGYAPSDGYSYLPGQLDAYVELPRTMKLAAVDVVFVDGRQRIRCALSASEILKPGGLLLIHDFWYRARYRDWLPALLEKYSYAFSTPEANGADPQGLAVFIKR